MPGDPAQTAVPAANLANLQRLFALRNIAILGQCAAVAIAAFYLHMPLPLPAIFMVIGALGLFNACTGLYLRRGNEVTQQAFFLQLSVDVLALTALLYLTGGAGNPFVLLFLMPLTIAATVLPGRYTWALTAVTVSCYSLLVWKYVPMPHMQHSTTEEFGLHVLGMWLGFVLSAGLIAYFVVGMSNTLQRQREALASAREQALRDERLVALGALAAGAAHELGTPLGTMALITRELQEDCQDHQIQARLNVLAEQVRRCKDALATLSAAAGGVRLTGGQSVAVDAYLGQLLDAWHSGRPQARIQTHWDGLQPAPTILADRTLSQAMANILDNAADASPESVEWDATWDERELIMEVRDRGAGLTAEAQRSAGKTPFSNKTGGLGLGLFLAHSIISRFGGSVTLHNRPGGGVRTSIRLPFARLALPTS